MITLDQVEKLRERANVSYEDAKEALEVTEGDLLEAVIFLERQGKISGPGLHSYNTRTGSSHESRPGYGNNSRQEGHWGHQGSFQPGEPRNEYQHQQGPDFKQQCRTLWRKFCDLVKRANTNQFEVIKDGRCLISMPVTLLIISAVFFFWVTLPILVIALFFGCRYRFRGPDLGKDTINNVMDQAADTAESIKRSVMAEEGRSDEGNGR
ncbi:MAG: DUF4342 domain-containing protein [Clostridiales bacterium]